MGWLVSGPFLLVAILVTCTSTAPAHPPVLVPVGTQLQLAPHSQLHGPGDARAVDQLRFRTLTIKEALSLRSTRASHDRATPSAVGDSESSEGSEDGEESLSEDSEESSSEESSTGEDARSPADESVAPATLRAVPSAGVANGLAPTPSLAPTPATAATAAAAGAAHTAAAAAATVTATATATSNGASPPLPPFADHSLPGCPELGNRFVRADHITDVSFLVRHSTACVSCLVSEYHGSIY